MRCEALGRVWGILWRDTNEEREVILLKRATCNFCNCSEIRILEKCLMMTCEPELLKEMRKFTNSV